MATTTNFGWETPDDTDLVKDGAAAIRTALGGVDTSFVDLKGGTTGQVLSKASNTDLDYTWVTTDDANAIQNAIVDAKGDLIAATAADTPARLAVGANDLLLTAASGEATGLKYTGGWTTWTPTWTALTVGNGTVDARYSQIAKTVHVYMGFTMGSTSVMGNSPRFTLPIAQAQNSKTYCYSGEILDSGAADYFGTLIVPPGGPAFISFINTSSTSGQIGYASSTSPFTWTTGDGFQYFFSYEVA